MTERPHLVSGILRRKTRARDWTRSESESPAPASSESELEYWSVELTDAATGLVDGAPVRVVLWDERPKGSRSEIEEIARVQQLDIEIIATSLAREGALAEARESFLDRVADAVAG